jgi:hypothetical protein
MHKHLYNELRIRTFLIQFYVPLTRGRFDEDELKSIHGLIVSNIDILEKMRPPMLLWDGRYDVVQNHLFESDDVIKKAKEFLALQQIGKDEEIAEYIKDNPDYYIIGIDLKSLSKILDISEFFRKGHMLHDRFLGYQEKHFMLFYTVCLDYVHSAAHFYNEGYEYFKGKKEVKTYDQISHDQIGIYEMRRIQPKEEIMFRNFREAYINIILFIESFINCVGYDGYLAGLAQTREDELKLQGIQGIRKNGKSNYSTLNDKLENISRIIGGKKLDTGQEPFLSYQKDDVELRNLHVHSKLTSQRILLDHNGWKCKCDEFIDHKCFSVLDKFWKSCYPGKPFPVNIFNVFNGNSFKGHQGKFRAEPA